MDIHGSIFVDDEKPSDYVYACWDVAYSNTELINFRLQMPSVKQDVVIK